MADNRGEGLAVFAVLLGVVAVLGSIVGVGLGIRAIDEAEAGGDEPERAVVTLPEFVIAPDPVNVPAGGTLDVRNEGSVAHNLAVEGTGLRVDDLAAGEGGVLDVSSLAPGHYTVLCEIAGHADAGMRGTLMVGGPAGAAPGGGHAAISADEMDETMAARTKAFPASTKGRGTADLAPTVLADGTKEFRLTTQEIDWEVEPGKVVRAMAYNGIVPGPTMRVDVGDHVRVVVTNEMTQSTTVHFHGVPDLPNDMDGVPDITQAPIKPRATFTYEFTPRSAAVAIYHSHHNAQVQVPNGLFGAFYIGELPLPAGAERPAVSLPMVLNDAGTIGYSLNGKSFPATEPIVARLGQWVRIDYMNEGMQGHPMHLHGMPQLVFAKDGYTLAQAHLEDTVWVAPGERVSVLVHATEPGTWAYHCHILNHAEREDGMFGMVTAMVVQ